MEDVTMAQQDPRRFPFPPLIPVVALLASFGLGLAWPLPLHLPRWTVWLGLALFAVPLLLAVWAARTFRRRQTPVNPLGEVADIVDEGPFAYTRNPMYLALTVMYVGGALLFRLPWAWVLLIPVFLALHLGVILPEEKYLAARFGEPYLRYKARVRRWI
jgi:protein-S-isoprenylcysteine O-methyltransferase Ste14